MSLWEWNEMRKWYSVSKWQSLLLLLLNCVLFLYLTDVCWSFLFSLYVPTYNLPQILQMLVPGTTQSVISTVYALLSEPWALLFCCPHNLQRASTSIISFDLRPMPFHKEGSYYRTWNHKVERTWAGISSRPADICLSALPCASQTMTILHLSPMFFIHLYLFHYVLSEGAALEDHSVFMPLLTIYELTWVSREHVHNWQRMSSWSQMKERSGPDVAKWQKPSSTLCHAAGLTLTLPFIISDTYSAFAPVQRRIATLTQLSVLLPHDYFSYLTQVNTSFPIPAICV